MQQNTTYLIVLRLEIGTYQRNLFIHIVTIVALSEAASYIALRKVWREMA